MPVLTEHERAAAELAEKVFSRAQAAGVIVSKEIRLLSIGVIRELVKKNLPPIELLRQFMKEFRVILNRYGPVLARTVSDAHLAAWLNGGYGAARLLAAPGEPPPDPPDWTVLRQPGDSAPIVRFPIIEEAASDLAARDILTPTEYYAQADRGRIQGFTVSRVASLDAMEKVRDLLTEAIIKGETRRTFERKAREAIDASQLSPARMDLIFRNVVNGSYARGQKAVSEHKLVRSAAAFAWRTPIDDSRLTALCRALSRGGIQGTGIYAVDDPVWRKVAPISHWGCRCSTILLSPERAAEKGLRVAEKWVETGERPSDAEMFVSMPDLSDVPESERAAFADWVSPWAS